MMMTVLTPLAEGKTKILYPHETHTVRVVFKDAATAFNAAKKEVIEGKGSLNAQISAMLFQFLSDCDPQRIPTCFVNKTDKDNELIYRSLSMIPLEVVVRNQAWGSLCKRYPQFKEGEWLKRPVVEFFLKDNEAGDPLLAEDILELLEGVLPQGVSGEALKRFALRVNAYLVAYFQSINLVCADFKLEFGVDAQGTLVLGDEMSPDNFRLRDAKTGAVLDKDVFRLELGSLKEAYTQVFQRLQQLNPETSTASVTAQHVFEAKVRVGLRPNVLHPESRTIFEALHTFGFQQIEALRSEKLFTIRVKASHQAEAEQVFEKIASDVLANPVIEAFELVTLAQVLV
ncbi:MAG: phosphoribosylformylglycinamidine synthase subunit PurS [Vampirovibrionales bacterium]